MPIAGDTVGAKDQRGRQHSSAAAATAGLL